MLLDKDQESHEHLSSLVNEICFLLIMFWFFKYEAESWVVRIQQLLDIQENLSSSKILESRQNDQFLKSQTYLRNCGFWIMQ